jgi:hypothetical protein
MEKQIVEGQIGTNGKYDLDIKDNELVLEVGAAFGPGSASVSLKLNGPEFLDMLKAKIPGQIDDAIFDLLKAAAFPPKAV